jgi:hypothetical protein
MQALERTADRGGGFEFAHFLSISSCSPVFLWESGGEEAFEFCDASGSFQPIGQVLQLTPLAILTVCSAQAMQTLSRPPTADTACGVFRNPFHIWQFSVGLVPNGVDLRGKSEKLRAI